MAASREIFVKTAGTRMHAVVCTLLLALLLADLLRPGNASLVPILIVATLLSLAVGFLVSAFGDHYVLEDDGVRYENAWLARLGFSRVRRLPFDGIASVREHRGRTLFLRDTAGRRFVIDAVEDYFELRDRILRERESRAALRDSVIGDGKRA